MNQVGRVDEPDALRLCFRKEFGQGAKGFRVRMTDGNSLMFLACLPEGQFQLPADGADVLNIIQKRHVAKGAGNAY